MCIAIKYLYILVIHCNALRNGVRYIPKPTQDKVALSAVPPSVRNTNLSPSILFPYNIYSPNSNIPFFYLVSYSGKTRLMAKTYHLLTLRIVYSVSYFIANL